jgi:parvulin-like peptidyl-prolyl isomerase
VIDIQFGGEKMAVIARIEDESITADEFVKRLRITNAFQDLLEDIIGDKLTVRAAKKRGIKVNAEEVQERADQFRRIRGLHRAKDTSAYLDTIGFSLDDFENYLSDSLYKEKMINEICGDKAVEEYFRLNSPKFENVELSHILLDSESKAKEIQAILEEDPESFAVLAKEHSLSQGTRDNGGLIGKVTRGVLPAQVEAKVFNAARGEILGPFASGDEQFFEIFMVNAKEPPTLDEQTRAKVRKLLYRQWLAKQAAEHKVEVL